MTMNQKGLEKSSAKMGRLLVCACVGACVASQMVMAYLPRLGGEFAVLPPLVGDQVNSQISIGDNGGYMVWEDNALDGSGLGIVAAGLTDELGISKEPFVVNVAVEGDQQNPDLAVGSSGHTMFTWETNNGIFARVLDPEGAFLGSEFAVSETQVFDSLNARVESIGDDRFAVVWQSEGRDGHRDGVYGRVFNHLGQPLGEAFNINQHTKDNQRNPDIAATPDGGFMVSWVSEMSLGEEGAFGVGAWGRYYDQNGAATSNEQALTDPGLIVSDPQIAIASSGLGELVFSGSVNPALSELRVEQEWNVYHVGIGVHGQVTQEAEMLNHGSAGGAHISPRIVAAGEGFVTTWNRFSPADGIAEIEASVINPNAVSVGEPFQVNTLTKSVQNMPNLVGSEGTVSLIWSSYQGGAESFGIKAQRFSMEDSSGQELPQINQVYLSGHGFNTLLATWPLVSGAEVKNYQVYVDGSANPIETTSNFIELPNLEAGSLHQVKVGYVTLAGVHAPSGQETTGQVWGQDDNGDQLPDAYQRTYWGANPQHWEHALVDSDLDGMNNVDELMAGTNPLSARSVLNIGMEKRGDQTWLAWEMQLGGVYQIESSTDLNAWNSVLETPIVANDFHGERQLDYSLSKELFRVVRLK